MNYKRLTLFKWGSFLVALIFWKKDQYTPVHDHGNATARFICLLGKIKSFTYLSLPDRNSQFLKLKKLKEHESSLAGGLIKEEGIHKVSCISKYAISLHIYSKYKANRIYKEEEQGYYKIDEG